MIIRIDKLPTLFLKTFCHTNANRNIRFASSFNVIQITQAFIPIIRDNDITDNKCNFSTMKG